MLLTLLACAYHVPEPAAPLPGPLPVATAAVDLCRVTYASGELPHGLVVAHGKLRQDAVSTASGLLLEHAGQRWLIDGGIAVDLEAHLAEVTGFVGFAMRTSAKDWSRAAAPVEALRALGVEPASLTGMLVTHAHYDHLGGLLDIPGAPLLLPPAELDMVKAVASGGKGPVVPAEARGAAERSQTLTYDGPPLGPWSASKDLFGDGSAILFPMPGHTPGSMGAYLRLPDGRRVLAVGDTVWVREGYEEREPKGWPATSFDSDRAGVTAQIQALWALHRADPELIILPAHDERQWKAVFGDSACLRG